LKANSRYFLEALGFRISVYTRLLAPLGAMIMTAALIAPISARAALTTSDNTPFPNSRVITGAAWTSPRYGPPSNQYGDILPTVWADNGDEYTVVNDGGTDAPSGKLWKQSFARITGAPPRIRFTRLGDAKLPPPHTFGQIKRDRALWSGPIGPYYSSGLVEADHVLFATQQRDWSWGGDGPFKGLQGIAYSTDLGGHWVTPNRAFSAPLGNLSWVIRGRGGNYPDGYVYAIASEREFNATRLILGRSRPDVADLTDPAKWQWASGWTGPRAAPWPVYSKSLAAAVPIANWASHLTYPQMAYDAPLHRYLLTFTYSYAATTPAMWRTGSELVILEAPHPWGPFSFVAREPYFGPSNGYDPGIPLGWISRSGHDLWLKWAANFAGCDAKLTCSGAYGFNYRHLHLTLASGGPASLRPQARPAREPNRTKTERKLHPRVRQRTMQPQWRDLPRALPSPR